MFLLDKSCMESTSLPVSPWDYMCREVTNTAMSLDCKAPACKPIGCLLPTFKDVSIGHPLRTDWHAQMGFGGDLIFLAGLLQLCMIGM